MIVPLYAPRNGVGAANNGNTVIENHGVAGGGMVPLPNTDATANNSSNAAANAAPMGFGVVCLRNPTLFDITYDFGWGKGTTYRQHKIKAGQSIAYSAIADANGKTPPFYVRFNTNTKLNPPAIQEFVMQAQPSSTRECDGVAVRQFFRIINQGKTLVLRQDTEQGNIVGVVQDAIHPPQQPQGRVSANPPSVDANGNVHFHGQGTVSANPPGDTTTIVDPYDPALGGYDDSDVFDADDGSIIFNGTIWERTGEAGPYNAKIVVRPNGTIIYKRNVYSAKGPSTTPIMPEDDTPTAPAFSPSAVIPESMQQAPQTPQSPQAPQDLQAPTATGGAAASATDVNFLKLMREIEQQKAQWGQPALPSPPIAPDESGRLKPVGENAKESLAERSPYLVGAITNNSDSTVEYRVQWGEGEVFELSIKPGQTQAVFKGLTEAESGKRPPRLFISYRTNSGGFSFWEKGLLKTHRLERVEDVFKVDDLDEFDGNGDVVTLMKE